MCFFSGLSDRKGKVSIRHKRKRSPPANAVSRQRHIRMLTIPLRAAPQARCTLCKATKPLPSRARNIQATSINRERERGLAASGAGVRFSSCRSPTRWPLGLEARFALPVAVKAVLSDTTTVPVRDALCPGRESCSRRRGLELHMGLPLCMSRQEKDESIVPRIGTSSKRHGIQTT